MVPSYGNNAVQEGIRVWEHLCAEYQQQLAEYLKENFRSIYKLCSPENQEKCFELRDQMDQLPSHKIADRLLSLLPNDEEIQHHNEIAVSKIRNEIKTRIGAFKVGPIFFSNTHNADSRWNYAGAGESLANSLSLSLAMDVILSPHHSYYVCSCFTSRFILSNQKSGNQLCSVQYKGHGFVSHHSSESQSKKKEDS